ncbi:MAG: ATP-binding protein [Dokdonella sp.]|nr:ATP-binding protein [Dokdonella sp.]
MNPFRGWLRSAPVSDPVDRRNAPFLQVLLLFFGVFVPINKALFLYAIATGQFPPPDTVPLVADLATDFLLVASAWTALWLIRTGHFRRGVALFLSVACVCVGLAYAGIGLTRVGLDPIPLVLLSLAGLVMGRQALWRVLAALAAMLLVCMALSIVGADPIKPATAIGKTVSIAGVWLIVALVLDRTVAALRDSLEESEQRGRALEQAYARLEQEAAERERTREQLIHSQKLDVAGRLASGLAHDFGNVLTVILGYAQRRERLAATGGEPALISALEGVELAARRALAISRKLLSFSRLDVVQAETFEAGAALQDLQPMLRQLLGPEIRLGLRTPAVPLPIHMDKGNFELMVLNIAGNARDAIVDEGTFRIDVAPDDTGRAMVLTLSDDGPGMPASVRARAFEHFFTTKPKGVGTGLGLPVVRDIVLEAGGEIRIDCPPEGALRYTLPCRWFRWPGVDMAIG